ncbi:cytochrome c oxidase subunit II [Ectobacillus ponti]|uniref:Cytochrome aa3 subunit 2 n=1 Tax=Ectobacillus ponti TaxID=2961894 RepID=A0AA41X9F2_9BACI|nr:cytochrome c oxidase subunit II [Ectobacillus ponti]MCP8968805.1 cytochrome c oxidase subunit II [Ectobacillus ponti]
MHLHKYEKIWLIFGIGSLLVFLSVIGVGAYYKGQQPPSCLTTIDPEKVDQTAPFDQPGVKQVGDNHYQVAIVMQAFAFTPNTIKVPKGATVDFVVTTKDVVHGFEIAGTNVNMMVEPGYVSTATKVFDKKGEYLILCNEYCGTGHHMMTAKVEVTD